MHIYAILLRYMLFSFIHIYIYIYAHLPGVKPSSGVDQPFANAVEACLIGSVPVEYATGV